MVYIPPSLDDAGFKVLSETPVRRASGKIAIPQNRMGDFKKVGNFVIEKNQVVDLEGKANKGYEALKLFFESEELGFFNEVSSCYGQLRDTLSQLTHGARYLAWERSTPEAKFFDRYLLQYAVGCTGVQRFGESLRHYEEFQKLCKNTQQLKREREPVEGLGKIIIDDYSYMAIASQVVSCIEGYRTDLVLQAMDEIRERYPMPFGLGK